MGHIGTPHSFASDMSCTHFVYNLLFILMEIGGGHEPDGRRLEARFRARARAPTGSEHSPHRSAMTSKCPRCEKPVFFAEKVSSLGKNWHRFCLKCERCNRTLSAGGHAEHDGMPYCHKPCYATLFGPKGVNIGGAGSYIYDTPPATPINRATDSPSDGSPTTPWTTSQITRQQPKVAPAYIKTFAGETSHCPGCGKVVYFAEKVMSLGRNWHRPCLRCERCRKTLTPGGHAEHEGRPYCHVPCYGYLFGPKGVNIGEVGCYVYDKDWSEQNELSSQS